MKQGFTLVEMIVVIILVALLSLIVVPPLMNQISNSKGDVSAVTSDLIFTAAEVYAKNNKSKYPLSKDAVYCIPLYELVKAELLEEPLHDYVNDKALESSYFVKIKVNKYNEFELDKMYVETCTK